MNPPRNVIHEEIQGGQSDDGVYTPVANAQQPRQQHSIRIAIINTFTAAPEPLRYCGQDVRLGKLLDALDNVGMLGKSAAYPAGDDALVDVFVFCECIVSTVISVLLQPLAARGWSYCTRPLVSDAFIASNSLPSVMSGGVFIVSRFPIVSEAQHVFKHAIGADAMAAKGVKYARVRKQGRVYNVFGTHMQAWRGKAAARIRTHQAVEIRNFIHSLCIPVSESVFLAGDINIDRDEQFAELQTFLSVTELNMPPIVGKERYTVSRDNQLYGLDDPSQYTNKSWPNGCLGVYLDTLECVCCNNQWLDYVLNSRSHALPDAHTSSIRAVPLRVDPYDVEIQRNTWRRIVDVTDHYAAVGTFYFTASTRHVESDESPTRGLGNYPALSNGSPTTTTSAATHLHKGSGGICTSNDAMTLLAITATALIVLLFIVLVMALHRRRVAHWKSSLLRHAP